MKNHTYPPEAVPHAAAPCDPSPASPPEGVVATRVTPEASPQPDYMTPTETSPDATSPDATSYDETSPAADSFDPRVCIPFAPVSAKESSALALSPAQRTALEMVTAGYSLAHSAAAAGVHRTTLYRWLTLDPQFAAAHNAWQHDALATARGRLLALTDTAVTSVGHAMATGDGRLALQLLDRLGLTTAAKPGPTDAADVQRDQNVEQRRRKLERRKSESKLTMDEMLE